MKATLHRKLSPRFVVFFYSHLSYFHVLTRSVQLHDLIVLHPTLTARQKAKCALAMAEADKALCDGADEELWILEVAVRIHKAVSV